VRHGRCDVPVTHAVLAGFQRHSLLIHLSSAHPAEGVQSEPVNAHGGQLGPHAQLIEDRPEDAVDEVAYLQRLSRLAGKDQAVGVWLRAGDDSLDGPGKFRGDRLRAYGVCRFRRLDNGVPHALPHRQGEIDRVEILDPEADQFAGPDAGLRPKLQRLRYLRLAYNFNRINTINGKAE
jgi:hypothetical protein